MGGKEMTDEERSKYFLEEVFKNSRFNQVMDENPIILGLCFKNVMTDSDFVLYLRDIIIQSGEVFNYNDEGTRLLLGAIFTGAIRSVISTMRDMASGPYSEELVQELIDFLINETNPSVYKKTLDIIKNCETLLPGHLPGEDTNLYRALYLANLDLLRNLQKVRNSEDYEKAVQGLRF